MEERRKSSSSPSSSWPWQIGYSSRAFLPPIPGAKRKRLENGVRARCIRPRGNAPFVLISHGVISFKLHLRYCLHNISREIKWSSLVASQRESLKNLLFPVLLLFRVCYVGEKLDPRKVLKAKKTAAPRYKRNTNKKTSCLYFEFLKV